MRDILSDRKIVGDMGLDYLLDLQRKLELDEQRQREAVEADRKRTEEAAEETKRRQDEEFLRKTTMGDD